MLPNPRFSVDLVTFTEEVFNGKLHFLCSFKKNQSYYLRYDVVSTLRRRHVSTGRDESNKVVVKPFYGPNISQMK